MELKTLTVRIGGLCMLVQRTKPTNKAGLYVLMPKMKHIGAHHCPLFLVYPGYGSSRTRVERLSARDTIDLSGLAKGDRVPIKFVADVSSFTGNTSVDSRCFDTRPHPNLAARIILPLPEPGRVAADGTPGAFRIPPHYDRVNLYGQCIVNYNVTNPNAWDPIEIKGTKLVPDRWGHLEISFLHVRPRDLLKRRDYARNIHTNWGHQKAYFGLLKGSTGHDGPNVLIDDDNPNGEPDRSDGTPCLAVKAPSGPISAHFVDPYTCTLGGGCPPNESC